MPPTPCPKRLQRLINDANERPTNQPHALRLILHALQARRQNKGAETFAVESTSRVTINLDNFNVTVRTELELALKEIDPPAAINLIRECRVCNCLFWAGRVDKVVCDRHAAQWRKGRQRQKKKAEAEKQAAERKDAELKKALQRLSRTAVALLNAIVIGGQQVFYRIDEAAWHELKQDSTVRKVPPFRIVRRTLNMLVKRGYLTHNPHRNDPDKDYYFPEQHLVKAWTEMRGKSPTH